MSLAEAHMMGKSLGHYVHDMNILNRSANQRMDLSQLRQTDPDISLPSTKDHRVVPVPEAMRRANKEALMLEKRMLRELERVTAQEKLVEQELDLLESQLSHTRSFLQAVTPAEKMREPYLCPKGEVKSVIVRDAVQKQLFVQRQELSKSIAAYCDEKIALDISLKQLREVRQDLDKEVKAKDAALVTDTAVLTIDQQNNGLAPPNKRAPVLKPRSSWLTRTAEIMDAAGRVFQNASRKQIHSSATRRSRGLLDENFRLKMTELLQKNIGKSNLARPFLETKLLQAQSEIAKAQDTANRLTGMVHDTMEPMERVQMQEVMRNQRPETEFVMDSAAFAIQKEQQRWQRNKFTDQQSLAMVNNNLASLRELEASLINMLNVGTESQDTDKIVKGLQTGSSPVPAVLLDTVSSKRDAIERSGVAPSDHHIMVSHRLPKDALGQRSKTVSPMPHRTTMPRLRQHVTMTSHFIDSAPEFWSPPKCPPRGQRSRSRQHHVPPLAEETAVMKKQHLAQRNE